MRFCMCLYNLGLHPCLSVCFSACSLQNGISKLVYCDSRPGDVKDFVAVVWLYYCLDESFILFVINSS